MLQVLAWHHSRQVLLVWLFFVVCLFAFPKRATCNLTKGLRTRFLYKTQEPWRAVGRARMDLGFHETRVHISALPPLAVWPWGDHLASLSSGFLLCEIRATMATPRVIMRILRTDWEDVDWPGPQHKAWVTRELLGYHRTTVAQHLPAGPEGTERKN